MDGELFIISMFNGLSILVDFPADYKSMQLVNNFKCDRCGSEAM